MAITSYIKSWLQRADIKPYIVYTILSLAILLPLLLPGYVLTLDMVFGPKIAMPQQVNSTYLFESLLHFINYILPTPIIEKVILFSILFLSGVGAHRLVEYLNSKRKNSSQQWSYYFAGSFYMINPFTYARFIEGQYLVLLGYALLPFFAKALFQFLFAGQPDLKQSLRISLLVAVMSIISIHSLGYIFVLGLVSGVIALFIYRKERAVLQKIARYGGLIVILVLIASSYWLIPLVKGTSSGAALIEEFDYRHLLTFQTNGESDIGVVGNVIALYGYWGEREERFISSKDLTPLWLPITIMIIGLAVYGFWETKKSPEIKSLSLGFVIATVLAIGIAAVPFSYLNSWLIEKLPYFKGFREPQKFVALLALTYAVLGAIGLARLARHSLFKRQAPWAFLLLPLLCTPTFLWGCNGQLKSRQYPSDWYYINQTYFSNKKGSILFLPWHQYLYLDFVGRTIANPAPRFFTGRVIAGDNAEIGLIERQRISKEAEIIEPLLDAKDTMTNFGIQVAPIGVEYVLLAKTVDQEAYHFLDNQTDLKLVEETANLKLYYNERYP